MPVPASVIMSIDQEEQQLRMLPPGALARPPLIFSLAEHYYDLEVIAFRQCVALRATGASAKAAAQAASPAVRYDTIAGARSAAMAYCRMLEQEAPTYAAGRFCPTQ